ncbi:hypothetical protein LMOh7858_0368 [Listeria monocytogenes str. 4b H7858]|nr:hypothetical protein LMOh7858_0368 [Listeria monocytogenes str. 4b H7858] [Listeria monocytogenes serotype 4b str. H7858]
MIICFVLLFIIYLLLVVVSIFSNNRMNEQVKNTYYFIEKYYLSIYPINSSTHNN